MEISQTNLVGPPAYSRSFDNIIEFTSLDSLLDFLRTTDKPSFLKIGADWCPPCRTVDRALPTLAQNFASKVNILKIDSDKVKDIDSHFYSQHIPYLCYFRNGSTTPVATTKGSVGTRQFNAYINQHCLGQGNGKVEVSPEREAARERAGSLLTPYN